MKDTCYHNDVGSHIFIRREMYILKIDRTVHAHQMIARSMKRHCKAMESD